MIYQSAEDSHLLEKQINKYTKGKSFLDMGCGSGIQSVAAKKAGASQILAADISQESIKHCRSLKINTIKSNLFTNIIGNFDIIAFNPPYLPKDKREDKESQLATTGGKHGDEIIIEFLKQAKSHLNKEGIILLLLSSHTPRNKINKIIENHYTKKILEKKKLFMETLEVWELRIRE